MSKEDLQTPQEQPQPSKKREVSDGRPFNAVIFSLRYARALRSDRFSGYRFGGGAYVAAQTPRGQQIFDDMAAQERRRIAKIPEER